DYSFVGFPTPNRDGSSFGINLRFSISSVSKHKDGAWAFVRTVMSEENQKKAVFFPVIQSELDKQIEAVLETDEFTSEVKLEQFEVDRFINLINSVTRVSADTDTNLYKIISDEAASFFAGDRRAEEAAQLIQERVSLYLAEKK
ncbi:MAG: hypothetical protein GX025_09080, partial [Clostridiales bacterium]|nr:hypothetical protein [Clostridiales bacterium]